MPELSEGFTMQASIPVDTRFFVTGSGLLYDIQTVYNGLTVYVTASNEYFVLTDSSNSTNESGWSQLPINFVTSSIAQTSTTTPIYDIITGSEVAPGDEGIDYHSAHSDYQIYDANGVRAGSLIISFNGNNLDFTDFSNAGIGDQANYIELQVVLITDGIRIQAVNSDGSKTPQVKISTRLL